MNLGVWPTGSVTYGKMVMNIESLSQTIRAAGIFPVRVEFTHPQESDLRFSGTLEEYLAAVQALKSPVVFVCTFELTEDSFIYEADEAESLEEDEEMEAVDLRSIEPKLRNFMTRIGETGWFLLATPLTNGNLTFDIKEEWWEQLYELLDAATESVEEDRSAAFERIKAEEEQRKRTMLKQLQSLINDTAFQRLKTQKAMREYAVERFPELMEWNSVDLKEEIQNLAARIEAKGLGRK